MNKRADAVGEGFAWRNAQQEPREDEKHQAQFVALNALADELRAKQTQIDARDRRYAKRSRMLIALIAAVLGVTVIGDVVLFGTVGQARDVAVKASTDSAAALEAARRAGEGVMARAHSGGEAVLNRLNSVVAGPVSPDLGASDRPAAAAGFTRPASIAYGAIDIGAVGPRDAQGRQHWLVVPHVKNTGGSEPIDLVTADGWRFSNVPLDDPWFAAGDANANVAHARILPHGSIAGLGLETTDEAMAAYRDQKAFLYLFGRATYRTPSGEKRQTDWCARLTVPSIDYSGSSSGLIAAAPIPCRRHNCSDAGCKGEDPSDPMAAL